MKDAWDPKQYLKFEKDREKPFFDLMKMVIPKENMDILDLGSGTGKLTHILHKSLNARATLGIDTSHEMLKIAPSSPGLTFLEQDIRTLYPQEKYDLIFANATLQWIPGHDLLLERFSKALKKGGQIAFQVPSNFTFPTHTIAEEIAKEEIFKEELESAEKPAVLSLEEYSTLMHRLKAKEQRVRAEIYPLDLPSVEEAIEWVKGSLLTLYRSHLSPDLYQEFLKTYSERMRAYFGKKPLFIPFKRLLVWAQF